MKSLIILFVLSLNVALGATYELKPASESVRFRAKGVPSFIAIEGSGSGLEGVIEQVGNMIRGELVFELSSVTTGIELRDDHLKNKYLNISQYPHAKLTLKEEQTITEQGKIQFKAILGLHGVEREIHGSGFLAKDRLTAQFALNLSDFQIEIPSFQGITVAQEVLIEVDAPLLAKQNQN